MLTDVEEQSILDKLKRKPTAAEVAIIDALWSEHCCYKSSQRWFYLFNTDSDRVKLGIGEGAGLIDVGDGYLVGIGLESHNHPSAVDPFNGAATGVGGIIRDILSQGCRPVAVLDCLRFGLPTTNRQRLLLDQVVLGISSYGNCVGIPNLGGDVEFSPDFAGNPLVNAMCVGVVKEDEIIRSVAKDVGHKFLLFGAKTGRDGIGGVTFASENLESDDNQESRGSVQIGDPLTEKLLIDLVLELRDKGLISALQDLGGGGLACAAVEMSERGGTGVELRLEEVPTKATNMQGFELLVSESQERMLATVAPDKLDSAIEIIEKYELPWAVVGEVVEGNMLTSYFKEEQLTDVRAEFVVNGFPEPPREVGVPRVQPQAIDRLKPQSVASVFERLMTDINVSSRKPVYQQYDQHVQGNTAISPGTGAGGIKLPNGKFLAMAAGTNSYLVNIDNETGAALATLNEMRKVITRGAEPIGMVDSLNFGNPEKPSSYAEFVSAIRGVAEVSHEMHTPVVGGNVSLYNESDGKNKTHKVLPSPFVGIVGLRDGKFHDELLKEDQTILILGQRNGMMTGSLFASIFEVEEDQLGTDYVAEFDLQEFLVNYADTISTTTIGRGGLLIALAKWAIYSDIGIVLDDMAESYELLFGENTARYLVATSNLESLIRRCEDNDISYKIVGKTNTNLRFKTSWFNYPLEDLNRVWSDPILEAFNV